MLQTCNGDVCGDLTSIQYTPSTILFLVLQHKFNIIKENEAIYLCKVLEVTNLQRAVEHEELLKVASE